MNQAEKLIWKAQNELTEYSTEARKIERLRQTFSLVVPYPEQKGIRKQIASEMPKHFFAKLVEENRQTIALPFWGIGGLGLLLGIASEQAIDFVISFIGFFVAYRIQSWGWQLQAKRLVLKTLDAIEASVQGSSQQQAT